MARVGSVNYKGPSVQDVDQVASSNNRLYIESTTITTSATEITFPEVDGEYHIFHQTSGGIVYYNSEDTVSSSDPKLAENDELVIKGTSSFTLYGLSDSGSVTLFVRVEGKE